jgi:serpin B
VVPDAGSFAAVRRQLPVVLKFATSTQAVRPVAPTVPIFKSQTHLSLMDALRALGVTDLFTPSADLSGIAGRPGDLSASDVIHQAVISVDEKGTEAAAATAMTMAGAAARAAEPEELIVDRPFFYCVHDTTTKAPLFLGQVVDPTA